MTTFREEIYPVFLPGQVLSSGRLNEIVRYLDGEKRVTRTDLIGTGIACGLQAQWVNGSEQIKPGYGVSSDGYLINLPCPDEGGDHVYNNSKPTLTKARIASSTTGTPMETRSRSRCSVCGKIRSPVC